MTVFKMNSTVLYSERSKPACSL